MTPPHPDERPTFPQGSERYFGISDEHLRQAVEDFFATVITDNWWVQNVVPDGRGGWIVRFEQRLEPR